MRENDKMSSYKLLGVEVLVHFLIMYAVMFTMVNAADDIYFNLNNLYMTGMMVAPMVVLMLVTMNQMYRSKLFNRLLIVGSIILFAVFYVFERQQAFIGDKQFIRSMIPHHSGAILMCDKAVLRDAEIIKLCGEITEGQKKEIEQMKEILRRL